MMKCVLWLRIRRGKVPNGAVARIGLQDVAIAHHAGVACLLEIIVELVCEVGLCFGEFGIGGEIR